jgi:1,4-alpha-glucan branching enzyme
MTRNRMTRNPVPKTAATTQTRQSPPERVGVPSEAVEAILQARHGDPFSVLGPHQIQPGRWEVRAMLPDAQAVEILSPDGANVLGAMERRHEAGFFVAPLTGAERPF